MCVGLERWRDVEKGEAAEGEFGRGRGGTGGGGAVTVRQSNRWRLGTKDRGEEREKL